MPKRQWKGIMPRNLTELWAFVFVSAIIGYFMALIVDVVAEGFGYHPPLEPLVLGGTILASWAVQQTEWR